MRRWKPKFALGLWVGLLLLLAALVGAGYVGFRFAQTLTRAPNEWPVNLSLYGDLLLLIGLLLLVGLLAYRVIGGFTLVYEMDRNGVYVRWLGNRAVIPLSQIERVDIGAAGARMPWRPVQGIGYYWGQGRTAGGQQMHLFSTRSPQKALLIKTSGDAYAISPREQDAFVQDLEQRRKLGVVKPLTSRIETGRIFSYAFWNDPLVRWTLLLAFGLNLLLLGWLAAQYPDLAATIEMRFNAAGQVAELRPRHQVLFLPLAALLLSLLNTGIGMTLYRREPSGARLLTLASVVIQVLFGVAIAGVVW